MSKDVVTRLGMIHTDIIRGKIKNVPAGVIGNAIILITKSRMVRQGAMNLLEAISLAHANNDMDAVRELISIYREGNVAEFEPMYEEDSVGA